MLRGNSPTAGSRWGAGCLPPISPSQPPPPPPPGPSFGGPMVYAVNSRWNTPIPANAMSILHPDDSAMMTGVWYSAGSLTPSGNPHAWKPVAGYSFRTWCGPRQNVGRSWVVAANTPTVGVYLDFPSLKTQLFQVPIPSGLVYKQDFASSDTEHRTVIHVDDGTSWVLEWLTAPGEQPIAGGSPDSFWHARTVQHRTGGSSWTGRGDGYQDNGVPWPAGTAGKTPHDAGLITGQDMQNVSTGGSLTHALCLNISNTVAAGQAHPRWVWPCAGGDGTTQTTVGVPLGATIILDTAINVDTWPSVTKEWQRQLLRTFQIYGGIPTDTAGAQGAGDGIMCQFPQTQQAGAGGYVYPWVADGSGWSYNNAFPDDIMAHFHVIDWSKWTGQ